MATYLQLVQRLARDVGIPPSGLVDVTTAAGEYQRLAQWVARANTEVQMKWMDWEFLWLPTTITTVASTSVYSGPTNLNMWQEDAFVFDERLIPTMSYQQYRNERPDLGFASEEEEPEIIVIRPNKQILIIPTPSVAYTISAEYQRVPNTLSVNGDVPLIPTTYQDVIVHRARMYWAEYEEAQLSYQAAAADYAEWLRRLEAAHAPTFERAHGRVQGADIVVRPE